MHIGAHRCCLMPALLGVLLATRTGTAAESVFIRVKVVEPAGREFKVNAGGHRHAGEPWSFKGENITVSAGRWSEWRDLSGWPWHGRSNRSGGLAEWPSMSLSVEGPEARAGCALEVQLADRPAEDAVLISFREASESRSVRFLVPTPLREHKDEFETGSQMSARHLAWAREATGGTPIRIGRLGICTSVGNQGDPALARLELQALSQLGFNIINADSSLDAGLVRGMGFRLYQQVWIYEVHPERNVRLWKEFVENRLNRNLKTPEGQWEFRDGVAHWVLKDEIASHARFYKDDPYDGWFRQYLRDRHVTDADLGQPLDQLRYPSEHMQKTAIVHDEADLKTRKVIYYASRFAQWLSTKSLRGTTDLVHETLPGSLTETLPTSHGFFGHGMDRQHLDFFELGRQRAIDQLSAEDWLGLNHMYGPNSTYTGAQTLGYLCAVMRSAIQDQPDLLLRSLITPSDDAYLRLKAYSSLGQGAKSFFYWAYGPTCIATENYWSDLQSMYRGIARVNRAISKAEDVLAAATPVRDPVAMLYSVSNDIWGAEEIAEGRVEKRLLWHGLRHLGIQPDLVDEDQVAAGRLDGYKVLYVTDWCLRRDVSRRIDEWVKKGGTLYLSGGAATRDEFYEPFQPPFARAVWPDGAAGQIINRKAPYNERYDLPRTPAITSVRLAVGEPAELPVLGCRAPVRAEGRPLAAYADGAPAGCLVSYGQGRIYGLGFMPMLAYGQLAGFRPTSLEEKWPAAPRELIRLPLDSAKIRPVAIADVPVVETSLLGGRTGSILVLANFTYQPIARLGVDITLPGNVTRATSTEGATVSLRRTAGGVHLELPLECTDLVILQ